MNMLKNFLIVSLTTFLLATSNVSSAHAEKFRCVGFSFIISIQKCKPIGDAPKAVVSDYCQKLKGKADRLKFSKQQLAVLNRDQKEILAGVILDYQSTCLNKKLKKKP